MTANDEIISAVAGVDATALLERIAAVRAATPMLAVGGGMRPATGHNPALRGQLMRNVGPQLAWGRGNRLGEVSMADFMACDDDQFLRIAHLAVLGRLPTPWEAQQRKVQLRAGRPRALVLARLLLAQEAQGVAHPMRGVLLPIVARGLRLSRRAATQLGGRQAIRAILRRRQAGRAAQPAASAAPAPAITPAAVAARPAGNAAAAVPASAGLGATRAEALAAYQVLLSIPVIGRFCRTIVAIWRLPYLMQRVQQLEAQVARLRSGNPE